jgi:hypothetical protein
MNREWVTPKRFNPSLITVVSQEGKGDVDRYSVLYKYHPDKEPSNLLITVPLNKDAFVVCRGVRKDTYNGGNKQFDTNRYAAQFVLDIHNEYHNALYKAFESITEQIETLTNSEVKFPITVTKEQTKCIIYTTLIHSNAGKMYSIAYTEDEKEVDILTVGESVVRPLLLVSFNRQSPTKVNIKLQVSEMLVHKQLQRFALATID